MSDMHTPSPRWHWLALITLSMALSGCALAPGMYLGDSEPDENAQQAETTVKPIFRKITAQLIQQEQAADVQAAPVDLKAFMTPAEPYKIGSGDNLSITVWEHPELALPSSLGVGAPIGYAVSAEGKIQFPYAGDLKVDGLTEAQARDLLVRQLSKFIKAPEVTLRVASYRSKRIYLDGEVKQPGAVNIDDIPLTLPEALSRAGGVTQMGDQSRVSLTRAGVTNWVSLSGLSRAGISPSKILLRNGDLVRVASRDESKVFVLGEVNKPGALPMLNGRLTLSAALGEVGGLNSQTANGNQIYVIRNANDAQPLVYHLDAHSPVVLALAENFELKPKDVVYVDTSSLVRFNRVIGLILPSSQEITLINRGFK
jgi:polysaccharide biosynthesis/export protein